MNLDLHVNLSFSNTTDQLSDYYVVLHDFETKEYFRPDLGYSVPRSLYSHIDGLLDRQGYPETCRLRSESGKGTPFTEELQWFDFNLCMMAQYGFTYKSPGWDNLSSELQRKAVSEWTTYHDDKRVLNNNAGVNIRANYVAEKILGTPLKSGTPLQMNLVMGGNVIKTVGHGTSTFGGQEYYEMDVWDGRNPEPNILTFNWNTHKHLVHWATNSTPFAYDRVTILHPPKPPWRVDPFQFFGGKAPYTVLSHERQWIPKDRVRRLRQEELWPKPYVP